MTSSQFRVAPGIGGSIRTCPEDFFVDEAISFEPDGSGEHLLVRVEKTGANTAWVASALAQFAGVAARDVSYAGRKDRHAVTRQWFSIWLPGRGDPDWKDCDIEGVRVLEVSRHGRKLRRGALVANRFEIVVRDLRGSQADLQRGLEHISESGVPNFFGPQRFGRGGSNLELARRWFGGELRLKGNKRSMALSAARSQLFNAVLARRLRDGTWTRCLRGDALNPQGSGGFFVCDQPDDEIAGRIAGGTLHVTGPMWGSGEPVTRDQAARLEAEVIDADEDLARGLAKTRLGQERRPLRVMPADLCWQAGGDTITLRFSLPKGAFATSVLDALMTVEDRMRPE